MAELSPITRLFVKISNSLSEEDIRNLRVILAREGLGKAKVEQATVLEMFYMLEEDNKIGKGKLRFLVQVLRSLGKGRLADETEQLEQEQRREERQIWDSREMDTSIVKPKASVEADISKITKGVENLGRKLTATGQQDEQEQKEIKEHSFKPEGEELGMVTKAQKVQKDSRLTIDVEEPAVESLPCSVTVTTNTADLTGGDVTPQIEVTSPQGKTTLIQTTAHTSPPLAAGKGQTSRVRRVWGAEWRPQESGKHSLGVCMGGKKDLGSLTVDVDSNNPVLKFGQEGSRQGQFSTPIDVAVRGDRLCVADNCNHRVQVFDLSGEFCHSFSTYDPSGLAVHTDGTIVVESGKEVKKFSPSGKLLHKFSLGEYCTNPFGLAVKRDGRVVVADPDKHSIFLFEENGTLVKQVGGQGKGEGQFDGPAFVCVDKEDNIIVTDKDSDCVQVFDKNLNFKHKFGQQGRQPQDMWAPNGVSADSRGNIVLANIGGTIDGVGHSKKLQVFRPNGTWLSTITSDGDKLHGPVGVAVTEDAHVFVADYLDNCIRSTDTCNDTEHSKTRPTCIICSHFLTSPLNKMGKITEN